MPSNMISKVTTTSVKINSRYIETSSNCGKMDNSNNNNADEPSPPGITSGHRDNSSSNNNNNNNNNNNSKHAIHNKCESLDEGTFAFMHWMNSDNKKSITSDNPIRSEERRVGKEC